MLRFIPVFIVLHHEFLAAACKRREEVDIRRKVGSHTDILLNSEELVPFVLLVVLIGKQYLFTVDSHSMSREELHHENLLERSVFLLLLGALEYVSELLFPLIHRGLVIADLIIFVHNPALLCTQTLIEHEIILGLDSRSPFHLHKVVGLLLHSLLVHADIFVNDQILDLLLIIRQGKEMQVVWHASEDV